MTAREDSSRIPIVLAGATGALGARIAGHLVRLGGEVRALVRPGTAAGKLADVARLGASPVEVDLSDADRLREACADAAIVVSALSGLDEVIVTAQERLLDAAVAAGVPRFIPSDYAIDYTRLPAGGNRNLDLRRRFKDLAEGAPIALTSILNGAFADMLTGQIPIIRPELRRVLYWGDADQLLDFTTMDDAAAVTAAVALRHDTPRFVKVAGDQVSARDLAAVMSELTGSLYRPLKAGPVGMLPGLARLVRRFTPASGELYPAWQGIQYMHGMFSGLAKLSPLDNAQFPDIRWTSARDVLAGRYGR